MMPRDVKNKKANKKKNNNAMVKLLFVCTGNICRSPTAEGVFRHLVQERGLEGVFDIDSAGTTATHAGEPPDPRAISVAARHGVELMDLRARAVDAGDFSRFDHIFAMDGGHYAALMSWAGPKAAARIEMFLPEGDNYNGRDVPDPWYGGLKDFEQAYALIHDGAVTLLDRMQREYKA